MVKKKTRQQIRKEEREKNKAISTLQMSPMSPSQRLLAPDHGSVGNAVLNIEKRQEFTAISINISKLKPPERIYAPDCFALERFIGYSDLYFGQKTPGKWDGELISCLIIRIPNLSFKSVLIDNHKEFYSKLLEQIPIIDEHRKHYNINLEDQFPISSGSQSFSLSNFVYGAHGPDSAELLFYKVSATHIHYLTSGKPSIVSPESVGVEGVCTINIPIDILSYFYSILLEKKDEY